MMINEGSPNKAVSVVLTFPPNFFFAARWQVWHWASHGNDIRPLEGPPSALLLWYRWNVNRYRYRGFSDEARDEDKKKVYDISTDLLCHLPHPLLMKSEMKIRRKYMMSQLICSAICPIHSSATDASQTAWTRRLLPAPAKNFSKVSKHYTKFSCDLNESDVWYISLICREMCMQALRCEEVLPSAKHIISLRLSLSLAISAPSIWSWVTQSPVRSHSLSSSSLLPPSRSVSLMLPKQVPWFSLTTGSCAHSLAQTYACIEWRRLRWIRL